jgi:hypothetical protein
MTGAPQRTRFEGALDRTLAEVDRARVNGLIMQQIERARLAVSFELFGYVWMALFNDRVARAARVLDRHPDAHGYWYIIEKKPAEAEAALARHEIDNARLDDLSKRLKVVRDGTVAHIDRRSLIDPKSVWRDAGITYKHLQMGLISVRRVVGGIYLAHHGHRFEVPEYDRKKTCSILEAAKQAGAIDG